MTTRYRVEYALKTHRRDQFIEWIKGLLAVPFVLCSGALTDEADVAKMADEAHRRYAEIMSDVESLIDDHIQRQSLPHPRPSKLSMLVPTAGPFFTRLPLGDAFTYQDGKRNISRRRYVAPSFNDVRLILNSAQLMAVTADGLELATFDGDVTLYEDGGSLDRDSEMVPRILSLMRRGVKIGIVTAAGYTTAEPYYHRLRGLLDALADDADLSKEDKEGNLVVMGGEANYLFAMDLSSPHKLVAVPSEEWKTPAMKPWRDEDIASLLDAAETALSDCVRNLRLPATVMRKPRAVGIIPDPAGARIARESLEETVLAVQRTLEVVTSRQKQAKDDNQSRASVPPFCAFNGGRDVFVDIGDKSWGVSVCQRWFGGRIGARNTLHVGDQFLSAGANDFRARSVGTTAWVASPAETVELVDELMGLL
ncbi:hypothetical protein L249_8176 [Ophiocordyceps polyrhachis-furcata BCC 54312]|uniref:IMP-specific 5'-nucleotidase 1 n=1 Tax=Ophiocordyceps polyrhachis-furcata BCC 54312 TaxID=1330021 RepID=A0A367LH53_9HYPO|nr:hypothetical protein L249_8176 [Ophiocordyceps polyrhachis-furcata BCC 54312]